MKNLFLITKKLANLFNFVRSQSYNLNQNKSLINKINMENESHVKLPFLQINGPEYIHIGRHSSIGKHAWISCYDNYLSYKFYPKLTIGNNVVIGNYACITAINEIIIEDGCLFSDYVYISDHAHEFNPETQTPIVDQPLESKGTVVIGSNCFVGMRVCILPNTTIGNNCVIGAHSVVTKSFPAYSMIAGVPAKLIKSYSFKNKKWENV